MSKRILAVFSLGFILMFYSEMMFWARWRPEDTISGLLMTWFIYSVLAFFVLLFFERFCVDDIYSIFLLGAVFGWLVEGVVVQTAYEAFPFQLVWTPLAWHALISVLIGLYFVGNALSEWKFKKAAAFFALLGAFWGVWAIYWKFEDGYAITTAEFAVYAFSTGIALMASYIVFSLVRPRTFEPTKAETWIFSGVLAFFALSTVVAIPFSPLVLLPLLGVSFYALKKLSGRESILFRFFRVNPRRYVMLLFMPLSAVIVYAFFREVWLEVNVLVALTTSSVGIFIFLKAIYKALRI
ncbi:hypothetical protein EP1X_06800 [Thermococcus sp. EP1]|nr:hypothetical protein EP1X_06800 [Thermococcus sp. EP1]